MSKRLNDKNNSLIIASLIIGIIGLVFLYNPSISIGLGVLTLIFGIFGIRKTKNEPLRPKGRSIS